MFSLALWLCDEKKNRRGEKVKGKVVELWRERNRKEEGKKRKKKSGASAIK